MKKIKENINNLNSVTVSSVVSPASQLSQYQNNTTIIEKGDSSATYNYIMEEDKHCVLDIAPSISAPIMLLNKTTIRGLHTDKNPLHKNDLHKRAQLKFFLSSRVLH